VSGSLVAEVVVAVCSRFLYFVEPTPIVSGGTPDARVGRDGAPLIRWRLAGSNQRFTGMAAVAVPGLAAAQREVAELRRTVGLLCAEVVTIGPGSSTWVVRRPDGSAVVRAPRAYARRVDSHRALARFVAQVPTAGEDPAVRQPGRRQPRARGTDGTPDRASGDQARADPQTPDHPTPDPGTETRRE